MENKTISFNELNLENVDNLSEEQVSNLLNKLVSELPRDRCGPYTNILSKAFDFRSIGSNNHALKGDLAISGFKFFPIPYNNKLIMGVKRKRINNLN